MTYEEVNKMDDAIMIYRKSISICQTIYREFHNQPTQKEPYNVKMGSWSINVQKNNELHIAVCNDNREIEQTGWFEISEKNIYTLLMYDFEAVKPLLNFASFILREKKEFKKLEIL